jgi:hypothetical protein
MHVFAALRGPALCACLFALLGATPAAGISLRDVTSISIDASVGGLGPGRSSVSSIDRRDRLFVRNDGVAIPAESVAAFLDVLERPPSQAFAFERTGFDRAYLASFLFNGEQYLDESRSLPDAVAAFEAAYFDTNAFDRSFSPIFNARRFGMITDYSPRLTVVVTAGKRSVLIGSSSQLPMMIPLTISEGGSEWTTCDAALPRAIANLAPSDATSMLDLNGAHAIMRWASDVARGPAVTAVVVREGVAPREAQKMAEAMGLRIDYRLVDDDREWNGFAWQADRPLVRYAFSDHRRGSPATLRELLAQSKSALETLRRVGWINAGLAASPPQTFALEEAYFRVLATVRSLSKSGHGAIAAYLKKNTNDAAFLTMSGPASWASGRWFLLPNGDMILYTPDEGATPYPFGLVVHSDGSVSE